MAMLPAVLAFGLIALAPLRPTRRVGERERPRTAPGSVLFPGAHLFQTQLEQAAACDTGGDLVCSGGASPSTFDCPSAASCGAPASSSTRPERPARASFPELPRRPHLPRLEQRSAGRD